LEAPPGATTVEGEPAGDVRQAVAQPLWLGFRERALEQELV
jgi:hypothetical protein